jgi:hypothetical protein
MDATVKKQGLLRRLQMPGANRERMVGALDHAEITERGEEGGWGEERKKRKKRPEDDIDFVESEDSTQIVGSN